MESTSLWDKSLLITSRSWDAPDLPGASSYGLEPGQPTPGMAYPSASLHRFLLWCRNINLLPITYAFRPRLRDRLTLGGLTLPRKPQVFGEQGFHLFCRYSCQHTHFHCVHRLFRYGFTACGTLPYRCASTSRGFGSMLKPRVFSAQTHLTSELLRFL